MVAIAQMKDKKKLKQKITSAVREMYGLLAQNPKSPFHFLVGKKNAIWVGYPRKILDTLPPQAVESFAGVGFHFQTNLVKKGDRVLDIGSGSGTDLFVAAKLVGDKGKAIGVDITDAMIAKAQKTAKRYGVKNVSIQKTDAENLPFSNASFDVVISNGVINLIPDKKKVFAEIYRVLKPGGILNIADIVLGRPISADSRKDPQLWAECIVGALREDEYLDAIAKAGFSKITIIQRFDYFAESPAENTREVAKHYQAHTIILSAMKGGE